MSHAQYFFLIDFTDAGEDAEDLIAHARSEFDNYAERNCDENNWSQDEILIMRDGRLFQMAPKGDWRGRDEWYDLYENVPQDSRWEKILRFAAACAAYEMGTKVDEGQDSFNDILTRCATEVPARLAELYAKIVGKRRPVGVGDDWLEDYNRKCWARAFERFHEALLQPFAWEDDPYTYRCYNLSSDGTFKDMHGILMVDIHT